MLLVSCASEPVLAGNALRLGIDAGLAGVEVAEDLDGIIVAALVGVNEVESYRAERAVSQNCTTECRSASPTRLIFNLPLFQSGWLSLMSRQVRAGFFLDPSGVSRFSI